MANFARLTRLVRAAVFLSAVPGMAVPGMAVPGMTFRSADAAQGQDGMTYGSTLPATAPTRTAAIAAGGARRASTKAEVEYTGGMLHVTANNSSLNSILKEVGRLTGMKITGGVHEDRVFGSYGPAPASEVLATLLDGTASNVLIVQNDQSGPAELILTPRRGGASPPNPNAAPLDDENGEQNPLPVQQQTQPVQQGNFQNGGAALGGPGGLGGLPSSNGGQTGTPIDGGANLGSTPGAFQGYGRTPPDATAQAPATQAGAADATPSNGVSTPQQIYEQLQRLRQQQQQGPTSPQ